MDQLSEGKSISDPQCNHQSHSPTQKDYNFLLSCTLRNKKSKEHRSQELKSATTHFFKN